MTRAVTPRGDGVEVLVWVVPGSRRSEIVGPHGDTVRIRVAAPPERGRANEAVADLLADRLGASVELVAGTTSRRKRFRVRGITEADARAALGL